MRFIFVLNTGSSTYKCSLFEEKELLSRISQTISSENGLTDHSDSPRECEKSGLWEAVLDWRKGREHPTGTIRSQGRKKKIIISPDHAFEELVQNAWSGPEAVIPGPESIVAVGHRVVHGGEKFVEPCLINSETLQEIEAMSVIAPLHNVENIKGIKVAQRLFPLAKQIAVFDTAFHRHMPEKVIVYPIPYRWREQKIRRYGFHGISHQYCTHRAEEMLGVEKTKKIITCHLGNGASLAAVYQGKSIDTTMGFTPLEGLMMGTRSGSVDPGVLVHLLNRCGIEGKELENMLLNESGLQGICGMKDMRDVVQKRFEGDEKAKLAFAMYVHILSKHIGAMAAVLNGVDALVFAGGIGENSPEIRQSVLENMQFLHIAICKKKNFSCKPDTDISEDGSRTRVLVIHTREDWEIAQQILGLCR